MANNLGDFEPGTIIFGKFTSVRVDTGTPTTLAGTPTVAVYKDNSATPSTVSGLSVDINGVVGLNHFVVDTSADATFFSAGSFFDVVISAGNVNGVSAVGYCVGQFTLRKTAALKPTVAGRTLDVSATGEAGIDWANIGSPTTAVLLLNTQVQTVTQVLTCNYVGLFEELNTGAIWGPGVFEPGAISDDTLSDSAYDKIADRVLNRDMAAGPDSGADEFRTPRQALRFLRNKWTVEAGVLTVYDETDSGVSWTATLSSTPGADPITGSDPA